MNQNQIIATPVPAGKQTWGAHPQMPMRNQEELDSSYVEIDLPSKYKFYDFKKLYIRPFKQKHLRKLIQGQANKNPRYIAEVINSCISCDLGYTDVVYRLCREDFTYLQYWERLHSFPNIPYAQICECDSPKHLEMIAQGKLSANSLTFTQPVNKATLDVTYLDENKDYDFSKYIPDSLRQAYPQVQMHIPFMEDYLQLIELAEKEVGDNESEGLAWFMTGVPASMLTITDNEGRNLSLKERFDIVDDLDPEDVLQLQSVKDEVPDFGVIQTINARCPRCGASKTIRLVLDAHSFLPEHHAKGSLG